MPPTQLLPDTVFEKFPWEIRVTVFKVQTSHLPKRDPTYEQLEETVKLHIVRFCTVALLPLEKSPTSLACCEMTKLEIMKPFPSNVPEKGIEEGMPMGERGAPPQSILFWSE